MSETDLDLTNMADQDKDKRTANVPLPEKIHLLSLRELQELITDHCNELMLYVGRFHPQNKIREELVKLKHQLEELHEKFKLLEDERSRTQGELEACRVLESQYVMQYQDLEQKIKKVTATKN